MSAEEAATVVSSRDDIGIGSATGTADHGATAVRLSPRGQVDEAFAFDRGATRLVYLAESRLIETETDLAAYIDQGDGTDRRSELNRAIDTANAELAASTAYRVRCREALNEAMDALAGSGTSRHDNHATRFPATSAAAAVVAEATAIAATAEQALAHELHFATVQAARIAEEAVVAAAATVAAAAEASRRTRQIAADFAAADVAAEAAATAANVQVVADVDVDVADTAATARPRPARSPQLDTVTATAAATGVTGRVGATARSQADETAAAARIVASAVAADAAAVAAVALAAATATERDVVAAAAAVQAVADAAARELALPTAGGSGESATRIADQRAADARRAAMHAVATTADAAQHARAARFTAATLAAATVARAAELTADAVQVRAGELGDDVAGSALAAELVARSVEKSAAVMAARNAAEELVIENHVRGTALALQAITTATAMQLAAVTAEREAALAGAKRAAAVASERLWEAERQLESAGRHDRAVAIALQQAMLSDLPQPTGMRMAARYITAVRQDRVGGDWYDALLLPCGSVTVMVGDVVGHDIGAAAMMGQLRSVLRTLVWENREPTSAVVERLDAVMRDMHLETMASLILVNVDEPTTSDGSHVATLRWSSAGHPAPILVHADGTAVVLDDAPDVILGVMPDTIRHVHEHLVPPGATLLLYTDGLIETRTQDHHQGRQRLLDSVRTHHRVDLDELLENVLADMIDSHSDDDIAVLAVRFGNEPRTLSHSAARRDPPRPVIRRPSGTSGT